jgi:hypothetical protein
VSFWEANRKLLIGIGAALVAAIVFHFAVVEPRRSEARQLERDGGDLLKEIEKYRNKDTTISAALAALTKEREKLGTVRKGLGGVLLRIEKGSPYSPPKVSDPRFYFQDQLNKLRKARTEGRPYPVNAPLGFTAETQKKDKPEILLERLAAVDRLTRAVERAGLRRVRGIRHRPMRTRSAKGVKAFHLAVLPMYLSATADERSLVQFLTEISRADSFLALESLAVEVTNPKARTFRITAGISALILRKSAAPRTGRPRPRTLPVGRY